VKKILFLFFVALLATTVFLAPRLVKIKHVKCSSQFGPCPKQIEGLVEMIKGKSYSSGIKIAKQMLSQSNVVKHHSLSFAPLLGLEIYIIENKPVIALKRENNRHFQLLGSQGQMLGTASETNLPVIILDKEILNEKKQFVSALSRNIFLVDGVKDFEVQGDGLYFTHSTGKVIIMPLQGQVEILLGSLEIILSRLNRDDGTIKIQDDNDFRPKEIDLRYKNPVLR